MDGLSSLNRAVFALPLALSGFALRMLGLAPAPRDVHDCAARRPRRRKSARSHSAGRTPPPTATEVRAMHRGLTAVLDAHADSRQVFRYLARLEQRLGDKGLRALDRMSAKHLRRALAQFEAIVTNWSSPSLADLRSRMAVALANRDSASTVWQPSPTISTAYAPRPMPMVGGARERCDTRDRHAAGAVEVDDVSLSRFEAAVGEWDIASYRAMVTAAGQGPAAA